MRKNWTKEEEEKLAELYKEKTAKEIAEIMSLKVEQVKRKVFRLGLKKSKEWKINKSRETAKNNIAFKKRQFKKGHVPYNKGKKLKEYATPEAIDRMKILIKMKKDLIKEILIDNLKLLWAVWRTFWGVFMILYVILLLITKKI